MEIMTVLLLLVAIALWRLIPKRFERHSVARLQSVIASMSAELELLRSVSGQRVMEQRSIAAALDTLDTGFISTDEAGRVVCMNAVSERITGWRAVDALGRSSWEVLRREGRPSFFEAADSLDMMINQGAALHGVSRVVVVSGEGHRIDLEMKTTLTRSEAGAVEGMVIVFREVSALSGSHPEVGQLAAIVISSTDAIAICSLDGLITSWNDASQAVFGYTAAEVMGRHAMILMPPEHQAMELNMMRRAASGETLPPFDTVRRMKSGRRLDVSVAIAPIRDGAGRLVGTSNSSRDISRQRLAAEELRVRKERLRFILEAAYIGDWCLDLATGAVQRSLRHDQCFGYDHLLPEWTTEIFLRHVFPDDRAEVSRRLESTLAHLCDWHMECRVVWPDATVHWIEMRASVSHEGDLPTRMLGIVMDTTRQRLAEGARLRAKEFEAENVRIMEAARVKGQFLANMSHELRTPLTAIIGFADLLESGAVKPDAPQHPIFVSHIGASGRHLLRLINDVLDLSKVESGIEFFPEPVHLPDLFDEVRDLLQSEFRRKQTLLVVEGDSSVQRVVLDPARLKQLLYNYLSNAIKFSPEQSLVVLRVLDEGPHHFRLEVEDKGGGIKPEDLPRLFVDFQQLDAGPTKLHPGTGLGLALTRRLAEAQGGSVGVRSAMGAGSVFHLVLPKVHGFAVAAPKSLAA